MMYAAIRRSTSAAHVAQHIRQIATTAQAAHIPVFESPRSSDRWQSIQSAKPFSEFLTDTHNRQHDYLRISLTERCNLRCLYCMPEEGVDLSPSRDILTTPEIQHLSSVFVDQGVTKIRLTGGEPTVRKDILPLMRGIGNLRRNGLKELALTTNGISLHRKLDDMVESGLTGVNISLDTLDPFQYQILTRRQGFNAVMKSIERVKEMNKLGAGIRLKINCVVMRGLNDHQILPFVEMTKAEDIEVRFIEYMPFGGNKWSKNKMMSYADMLTTIQHVHPSFTRCKDAKNDTSKTWQVPGYTGRVGFITSMTHNFCGTCNRLRITSDGNLKVCLHGNTEVSLRDMMRSNNADEPLDHAAAQQLTAYDQQNLLEVIGAAVKRKKARHAGMGSTTFSTQYNPAQGMLKFSANEHRPRISSSTVPLHLLPQTTSLQRRLYSTGLFQSLIQLIPQQQPSRSEQTYESMLESQRESQAMQQKPEVEDPVNIRASDISKQASNTKQSTTSKKTSGSTTGLPKRKTLRIIKIPADSTVTTTRSFPSSLSSKEHAQETEAKEPEHAWGLSSSESDKARPEVVKTVMNNVDIEPSANRIKSNLTHVNAKGEAHMVGISAKRSTTRTAIAFCMVQFGSSHSVSLIKDNTNKKGDVIGIARIAGIMAAKKTSELIPLCHPLQITKVAVDLKILDVVKAAETAGEGKFGGIVIEALVECTGQTGVEMEALTAVNVAALTVFDMCKAVDKKMIIQGARVVYKTGGKNGRQFDAAWSTLQGEEYFTEKQLPTPLMKGQRQDYWAIATG